MLLVNERDKLLIDKDELAASPSTSVMINHKDTIPKTIILNGSQSI